MTESGISNSENGEEAKLPRRDWVILPLTGLLTIALCLVTAEVAARYFFASDEQDACWIGPSYDSGYRHNCIARQKTSEGPWVTNQYNDCGYRTKESCGPKPAGTTRIAFLGSSMSKGVYVDYDQTYAVQTSRQLTRILGRPVEVQNLSRQYCYPLCVYRMVDEALALKPDLVIVTTDPWDIEHLDPADMPGRFKPAQSEVTGAMDTDLRNLTRLRRAKAMVMSSAAGIAAAHYLFQNSSLYARLYLAYGDRADFLRKGFSPSWEKRFDALDILLGEMAQKCRAANVPLVLIEVPSLAQDSLLKEQNLPAGVDPYAFNERLKDISMRHGIQFVDVLDAFKSGPEPGQLYYVVDTHLNGEGHTLVSRVLVEQLIKGQRAALLGQTGSQH
jgi:GDSL-like Lipase/Acylhydrolase family